MTSLAWFRIVCPQAAAVVDADVNSLLAAAVVGESPAAWDDLYALGMAWKAAHFFLVSPIDGTGASTGGGSAGGAGAVTSKRTGDVAITFGSSAGGTAGNATADLADVPFLETHAGRQYLALRRKTAARSPTHLNAAGLSVGV